MDGISLGADYLNEKIGEGDADEVTRQRWEQTRIALNNAYLEFRSLLEQVEAESVPPDQAPADGAAADSGPPR